MLTVSGLVCYGLARYLTSPVIVLRQATRRFAAGDLSVRVGPDIGKRIEVRDHGQGVPDRHIANLFRPFYRVSGARDRNTGGAGLGLAITERALKLHHGTAAARNAPDGGLVVTIQLPLP